LIVIAVSENSSSQNQLCMRDEFGDCIVGEYTGGAPRWLDGEQRLCDVPEEEQEEFWAGVVAMSAEYACL
jgi:hypothetical protein